ncbi:MAG: tRNA (N(6)-L-threonylcarbamoyladenosine(37)-C(2))-methylthiotransferase MtaB [Bacteroidales bacterium]|nr:tRNA (N(6)-L-threonylcarbamoyladenosine(37)-C(2))-methylthiotransferase MtaB [Bacteroidales bacterium]
MNSVAFVTLGCKLNYAETATYARAFKAAGFEVVPWSRGADLFVVNTCSVTATSDSKSRSAIRKLHRIRPDAPIVVTGCYAELRREEVAAIEGVALVFGAAEKARLVPDTLAHFSAISGPSRAGAAPGNASLRSAPPFAKLTVPPLMLPRVAQFPGTAPAQDSQPTSDVFGAYSIGGRTRSFLKVQDGCDNFCAYCTVPYARGRSRNLPICEVVRAAREIAASGAREIVLTGVNTGDFGRSTGESFLDLLKALNEVEGIERYRISSIEPNLITEEIVDWIASGTKFLPHFHIPLQTGSDVQLKRMGRKYTTAFFRERIEYIRARMEGPGRPKVFFGIDVMVGLPGETPELFEETRAFIESVRPSFIHIFPYSRRPGTRAAQWPDQVPEAVKDERVKVLEALCDRLHAEFVEANRGICERVLWESKEKDSTMSGFTGNYIKVSRPYDPALSGTVTEVIL